MTNPIVAIKIKQYVGAPENADKNFFANEVCATLLLLMECGGLNLPIREREFIGESFELWMELREEERDANRELRRVEREREGTVGDGAPVLD